MIPWADHEPAWTVLARSDPWCLPAEVLSLPRHGRLLFCVRRDGRSSLDRLGCGRRRDRRRHRVALVILAIWRWSSAPNRRSTRASRTCSPSSRSRSTSSRRWSRKSEPRCRRTRSRRSSCCRRGSGTRAVRCSCPSTIAWIYPKKTTTYRNGVKQAVNHKLIIRTLYAPLRGLSIEAQPSAGEAILGAVSRQAPWAFVGYDQQREIQWYTQSQAITDDIRARRDQMRG